MEACLTLASVLSVLCMCEKFFHCFIIHYTYNECVCACIHTTPVQTHFIVTYYGFDGYSCVAVGFITIVHGIENDGCNLMV